MCLLGRMLFSTNKKVGFLLSKKNFNHLTPPVIFSVGISGSECALRGKKKREKDMRKSRECLFPSFFFERENAATSKGEMKKVLQRKEGKLLLLLYFRPIFTSTCITMRREEKEFQ